MDFTCLPAARSPSVRRYVRDHLPSRTHVGTYVCEAATPALKQLPTKMSFAIWERRNHSYMKSAKILTPSHLQNQTSSFTKLPYSLSNNQDINLSLLLGDVTCDSSERAFPEQFQSCSHFPKRLHSSVGHKQSPTSSSRNGGRLPLTFTWMSRED